MVGQHRVVPGQLDELADLAQHRLGVEDQVLVADLDVVVELRRVLARLGDLLLPAAGDVAGGQLAHRAVEDRERDVAAVADHVHEARLGHRPLDQLHLLHVGRRLLAPARLALLARCRRRRRSRTARPGLDLGQRPQTAEHLLVGEAEVAPLAGRLHRLERALRGRVALARRLDQVGDEVGLGRDRQLGVGVEHHPQQGRAGAVHADHERHRLAARVVLLQSREQTHDQWPRTPVNAGARVRGERIRIENRAARRLAQG